MFDSPFDFLSLVIAIAALIFARKAYNQTESQIDENLSSAMLRLLRNRYPGYG